MDCHFYIFFKLFVQHLMFRFGSEIETDDGQKTKCVMARIKIYTKDGAESRVRPISDR